MAVSRIRKRASQRGHSSPEYKFNRPVLVVEDQESIAQYTATLVRDRWDCEVAVAHSLQSAREILKSITPAVQVAICDLNLPDAPHGEIIDLMNERGIATIALTGAFGEELHDALNKKGIIDFIPKSSVNAYEYAVALVGRVQKNHRTSVLIVDDSLSARALYKSMCELIRLKVYTASNGEEALAALKQHPEISLLMTDYAMPEMDGFELTAKVRSTFSKDKMSIIGISAVSESGISTMFLKCGANDYLAKPFSYEEFLCRINQNLDMLDLVRANQEAAQRDFMTKLYNRRYFFETATRLHAEARKKREPLIAAMIDLDLFKEINDKYGHDCGDLVIKHFASLLEEHFRTSLTARFGGEEFVAVLKGTKPKDARKLFDELRMAAKRNPVSYGDIKITYTVSIGLCDQLGETIDDLLKGADMALYKAKENHRDQVFGLN